MEPKLIVITGATRGLGRLAAEAAARAGARVVLACRDEGRGKAARDAVAAEASGPEPELLVVDLASLASVRRAAAEALERFPRIDVLVNNAGIFSYENRMTADGFELAMGTNYLGPFLLTNLLLPSMRPGSRIVNLVSDAYAIGGASLEAPARGAVWAGFMNYAASKRAMLQFTLALAERLAGRGITANALHPGVIRTGIMRVGTWYGFLVDWVLAPFWTPAVDGVQAMLGLALAPEFEGMTGGYYKRGKAAKVKARFTSPEGLERLWNASARLVGL